MRLSTVAEAMPMARARSLFQFQSGWVTPLAQVAVATGPNGTPAFRSANLDGAAHGVDHAGELDQHAVASGLDDAAVVLLDLGVDQRPAMPSQLRERALGAHQPAVPDHVRGQDGGELAFDPLRTHGPTHRPVAVQWAARTRI